jgi:glycosyltransferase involved in cell wall biosynthesis
MRKMRFGLNKSSVWVDGSFNSHKAGIGIDNEWVVGLIAKYSKVKTVYSIPKGMALNMMFRRIRNLYTLLFRCSIRTPRKVKGIFYQPQLTSVIAGKNVTRWVVRVHDIFPITNPEWFRPWATKIFWRSMVAAVRQNALIVCSSSTTKAAILKNFPALENNIFVLSCFPRDLFMLKCERCDGCQYQNANFDRQYFLAVGTIEPRKGFDVLAKNWNSFYVESAKILVIVGKKGWKSTKIVKRLRDASKTGAVVWLENVCDGSLSIFYEQATAFISSSLDEGFNLPALEARANYSLPLILSDIPVHRELHSDSAYFYSSVAELRNVLLNPLKPPQRWDMNKSKIQIEEFTQILRDFTYGSYSEN